MTREPSDLDLDFGLGAWMNEVATASIPVAVLEEAFARTMSSRQVRVYPWQRLSHGRSRSRAEFALVATAALLVAVLAFGSLGGGSGIAPVPSPTPSATPLPSASASPSPALSPSPSALVTVPILPTASVAVSQPQSLASDGAAVWVMSETGLVQRIDPATNIAGPGIQLGATTDVYSGIAAGGNGVWASDLDSASVYRIDPATSKVVAVIPAGLAPKGIVATATAVWVADTTDGKVLQIDPATNKVVATIVVGPMGSSGLGPALEGVPGRRVGPNWLASGLGSIWVDIPGAFAVVRINATTNVVEATIPIMRAVECGGFAVTPMAVWSTSCDGPQTLTRIDPVRNVVVTTAALSGLGNDPAVINGAPWLSIATKPGALGRISPATNAVDLGLAPGAAFGGGGDMVVADGSVWVIDGGNDRVLRLPLAGFPNG